MATVDDQRFVRLKPEFLASFDWRKAGVRRQEFAEWARRKREPALRVDERNWSPLKAGDPVPWDMVDALSEYVIDILKLKGGADKYRLIQIAEPSDPPSGRAIVTQTGGNAWRMNFLKLFSLKTTAFSVPPGAYCRGEGDLMDAALMIMHAVGYGETKSTNKAACLEYAGNLMKRTPAEYARLLLDGWKANEHAVLFAMQRQKDGTMMRAGVSVVIPISKPFFKRFRMGEAEDIDALPADMCGNSLLLLFNAVSDNPELDHRQGKARRSMDQAGIVLFQFASLCLPLNSWSANPTIITQGGGAESIRRLNSYHFKEVGRHTRLTGKPVMEFAPASNSKPHATPLDFAHFLAMKSTLLIYQYVSSKQPSLED